MGENRVIENKTKKTPKDGLNIRHGKAGERIYEMEGRSKVIHHYGEYTKMEKIKETVRDREDKLNEP